MPIERRENMGNKTIKAKYSNLTEFKSKFDIMSNFNFSMPKEFRDEMIKRGNDFIKKIEDSYTTGDELWHYDNFDVAPKQCGREYIMLIRNNKTVRSFLIRMS